MAAVKPQKKGLRLELMHFPEDVLESSEFKAPKEATGGESRAADGETAQPRHDFEVETSEIHRPILQALEKIIEEKIAHRGKEAPVTAKKKKPTNVVDLVSILRQSIQRTKAKPKPENVANKARAARRKRAA